MNLDEVTVRFYEMIHEIMLSMEHGDFDAARFDIRATQRFLSERREDGSIDPTDLHRLVSELQAYTFEGFMN